ncbi:uncharacterized protein LOC105789534 [Gossypium raimondii]|uniref:uncharacterized protein LOC105789534 n=1 Tax=Gossypium raimondii TaxID=29730 RepID=UPI00063AEFFE|nr:uncharacterized protein LOC105789534 [Gossypium raimondii]
MAISIWAVWYNRNRLYHEGKKGRVQEVVGFIRVYLQELEQVNSLTETRINPREEFWKPPKAEQVKANFDAAFSQQGMTTTAGIIIINHEGLVMGACTYPLRRTGDPTTIEAKARLQAIIFEEEMGFQDLVVEGDALTVIKKLKSDLVDRSMIDNIINEIQRKRFSFINLSFDFTPRKTNEAAHALATRGYNLTSPFDWIEEVPMEVKPTMANDQRSFLNR